MTTKIRLRDRIPSRVLTGVGGLLLAVLFLTWPKLVVWWINLWV